MAEGRARRREHHGLEKKTLAVTRLGVSRFTALCRGSTWRTRVLRPKILAGASRVRSCRSAARRGSTRVAGRQPASHTALPGRFDVHLRQPMPDARYAARFGNFPASAQRRIRVALAAAAAAPMGRPVGSGSVALGPKMLWRKRGCSGTNSPLPALPRPRCRLRSACRQRPPAHRERIPGKTE